MLLGVFFALVNLGILRVRHVLRFWPVVFIIIGLRRMSRSRRRGAGLVFLIIGTWLLLDPLGIPLHFRDLWPALLLFLGAFIVWQALHPGPRRARRPSADTHSTVNAAAILGGVERTNSSTDFQGGDLVAFLGGCEIDLRQAIMAGGEACIETFVMWGGIEIKVPEDWAVTTTVLPIMGGYEDKTKPPKAGDVKHRLVVSGLVIMGGIEIHN